MSRRRASWTLRPSNSSDDDDDPTPDGEWPECTVRSVGPTRSAAMRKKRKQGGSPPSRSALYREQGYLSPLRIYDGASAEHASFRAGFDALAEREDVRARLARPETRKECYRALIDRHFDQPWVWALATAPPVLDLVTSIIGPDVLLLATHIFVKWGEV